MVNLLSWNVKGLNGPNKQEEVELPYNQERAGLIGLLETKLKRIRMDQMVESMSGGWKYIHNLEYHIMEES